MAGLLPIGNDNKLPTSPTEPSRLSDAFPELQKWIAQPIQPLSRNLFTVRYDYFPSDGHKSTAAASESDNFWDQLAKSLNSQADLKNKHSVLVENLRRRPSRCTWTARCWARFRRQ